jgi:hypothetical protein
MTALTISVILSTIICAFVTPTERRALATWFIIIPIYRIGFGAIYVVREIIAEFRDIPFEDRDASDARLLTPLLPYKCGHSQHLCCTILACFLHSVLLMSVNDDSFQVQPLEGAAIILFSAAVMSDSFLTILPVIEELRLCELQAADPCKEGHNLQRCSRCYVYERDLKNDQPPIQLRFHPSSILCASALSSLILIYNIHQSRAGDNPGSLYKAILSPVLTLTHHAIFLLLFLIRASRKQYFRSPSPYTSLFANKWERNFYVWGLFVIWDIYVLVVPTWINDGSWVFWNKGGTEFTVGWSYVSVILLGAATVSGFLLDTAEKRAQCIQEGHLWRCARWRCCLKEAGQLCETDVETDVDNVIVDCTQKVVDDFDKFICMRL